MVGYSSIPHWLDALLKEEFFHPCLFHNNDNNNNNNNNNNKRVGKNLFCFDCCKSVCYSCAFGHRKHTIIQVRRYVYNDVLRLSDAHKLMDCSGIQAYITNNAKVIYLKERPLCTRRYKCLPNSCFACNRHLQHPFVFCSLSCKVKHIVANQGSLKINLTSHTILGFSDVDDCQMTPDSVLDSPRSTLTIDLQSALSCTATTEVVRKKRSNLSAHRGLDRVLVCTEPADTHVNRRKNVPNRAPLC